MAYQYHSTTMHRSDSHASDTSSTSPRHANYAQSSAYSSSANPNEDWTKISDLAERRRIQNRIAQRNYRKKLKRRLEDLEKRAGSSSASPEPQPAELAPTFPSTFSQKSSSSQSLSQPRPRTQSQSNYSQHYLSPEMIPASLNSSMTFPQHSRSASFPEQALSFSNYPATSLYATDDYLMAQSQQQQQYQNAASMYPTYQFPASSTSYMPTSTTTAPTLPAMMATTSYGDKDSLFPTDMVGNPLGMNFASLMGMDDPFGQQGYAHPMSNTTPPATEIISLDRSRQNSPNAFEFPLTPISRSASPNVFLFDIACA